MPRWLQTILSWFGFTPKPPVDNPTPDLLLENLHDEILVTKEGLRVRGVLIATWQQIDAAREIVEDKDGPYPRTLE